MKDVIYKDYLIKPIYQYKGGKRDFEVYPDSGNEPGYIFHSTIIEKIKEWIDMKTKEQTKIN